jgi:hypothetical protein
MAPRDPTHFVAQQRSLYVPAGDVGYGGRDPTGAIGETPTPPTGDRAGQRIALFLPTPIRTAGHDTITRSRSAGSERRLADRIAATGRSDSARPHKRRSARDA